MYEVVAICALFPMRQWPLRRRENCRINAPGGAKTRVFLHWDCPIGEYFCPQTAQGPSISAPGERCQGARDRRPWAVCCAHIAAVTLLRDSSLNGRLESGKRPPPFPPFALIPATKANIGIMFIRVPDPPKVPSAEEQSRLLELFTGREINNPPADLDGQHSSQRTSTTFRSPATFPPTVRR
jgi:hypothetical protein